jgi:hypothetical protein
MTASGQKVQGLRGKLVVCGFGRVAVGAMLGVLAVASAGRLYASDFTPPTKEELSMTSVPGFPGAAAVVLFREQITKDDLHTQQYYNRIKILTEDGKKYANVELAFTSYAGDGVWAGDDNMMGDIIGRTIHADGTIIPFTGKPYLKTIQKEGGFKVQEKIFTLPDVEVGSIIEYRYAQRYNDQVYEAPRWYIQGDLFLKAAHYAWYPTTHEMMDTEADAMVNAISWFPILPLGAVIQSRDLPGKDTLGNTARIYELTVKDVSPVLHEEFMPPTGSFSYRVLFSFTPYRSSAEYWKSKGKTWSKHADSFIGPNSDLRAATQTIIAGATTDDAKLRKIYATVMSLDNTDYSRAHDQQEDKAAGLGKVNNAFDVFSRKRGNSAAMTELFVGMARAAGMKAYLMLVTNRTDDMFAQGWQNFNQLNTALAIVVVDGKEQFFDPGNRYIPYGSLEWQNTLVGGVRQLDGGTGFANTPGEQYKSNRTARVANLTMDEHGAVAGKIDLSFTGNMALHWRQRALRGDDESTKHALRTYMEEGLPKSLRPTVTSITNLEDYEKPLLVSYSVVGTIGTPTGKRLVLPVDLFTTRSRATFPDDKRELAVYFHYPQIVQDALRIVLPKNLALEATPAPSKFDIKDTGVYTMNIEPGANAVTVRRTYAFNDILIVPSKYPELRTFYSQFEAKDQDSIVLKQAAVESAGAGGN